VFFTSPISLILLLLSAAAVVFPIIQRRRRHRSLTAEVLATGAMPTDPSRPRDETGDNS
jgi:hypothetical protein